VPSLLELSGDPAPVRAACDQLALTVEEALDTAQAAGYRVDVLRGQPAAEEPAAATAEPETATDLQPAAVDALAQNPQTDLVAASTPLEEPGSKAE